VIEPFASTDPAILVVADAALSQRLRERVDQPVVDVANYLEAIGEANHRPIRAIVGRLSPMRHAIEPTARALRAMTHGARMLLVAEPADEPLAMRAIRLGFDDYLIDPINHDAVVDLLNKTVNGRSRDASPARAAGGDPAERSADAVAGSDVVMDADQPQLLETLLHRRGELRELALQLIRQRVGDDVRWSAEVDPDVKTCIPLRFDEVSLGYLLSDSLDESALAPWRQWLSSWLAAERRISELDRLAFRDELTDAWNRRYFNRFLESVIRRAREQRFRVTLMVFDIDDFKQYNDRFGHAAGDEILTQASKLMRSLVRRHDVVARIGGDEFAVIFWDADEPRKPNSEHPNTIRRVAERFQKAICQHRFPKLGDEAPATLTISGGLASYPWDGQNPEQLMELADDMLLRSKRQGKNCITFGPGAMRSIEDCNADQD
jgi:diguanylate cyclase (GGDEF)-like protein